MDYRVPELGEGVYEAELVEWLVRAGQRIERGQPLVEVMTDKATLELPAPFSGVVNELTAQSGQKIDVGQAILHYTPSQGTTAAHDASVAATAAATDDKCVGAAAAQPAKTASPRRRTRRRRSADARRQPVPAAPAVRRLARAMGVDLRDVSGTGPGGRVLVDDLGAYVRHWKERASSRKSTRATTLDLGRPGQRIKLQGVRRVIAEHMVRSKQTIPHYSYVDECDVSEMVALRSELKRPFFAEGVKLTSLPFFVKAVVNALQRVPIVNASLDERAGEIVLHDQYHIGVATATARGLVVPVIRDADRLDLAGIAREIERLVRAAQAGTLARDELRGGTFTVSSVGNIGGLVSTPIIHHPEVGILAIGKVFKRPSYNEAGEIVPARIAYLSFSFDHRVVDGALGAVFGNAVIEQLKQPESLLHG